MKLTHKRTLGGGLPICLTIITATLISVCLAGCGKDENKAPATAEAATAEIPAAAEHPAATTAHVAETKRLAAAAEAAAAKPAPKAFVPGCWNGVGAPKQSFMTRNLKQSGKLNPHHHQEIVFEAVHGTNKHYPLLILRAGCEFGGHDGIKSRADRFVSQANLAYNSLGSVQGGRNPVIKTRPYKDGYQLYIELNGNPFELLNVCKGDSEGFHHALKATKLKPNFPVTDEPSVKLIAKYWASLLQDTMGLFYHCEEPKRLADAGVHAANKMKGLLVIAKRRAAEQKKDVSLKTFHEVVDIGLFPRSSLETMEQLSRFVPANDEHEESH